MASSMRGEAPILFPHFSRMIALLAAAKSEGDEGITALQRLIDHQPTHPLSFEIFLEAEDSERKTPSSLPFISTSVAFAILATQFQRATPYRNLKAIQSVKDFEPVIKKCAEKSLFDKVLVSLLTTSDPEVSEILGKVVLAARQNDISGLAMNKLFVLVANHLRDQHVSDCDKLYAESGMTNIDKGHFVSMVLPLVLRSQALVFLRHFQTNFRYAPLQQAMTLSQQTQEICPHVPFEMMTIFSILVSQFLKVYSPRFAVSSIQLPLLEKVLNELLIADRFKAIIFETKRLLEIQPKPGEVIDFTSMIKGLLALVIEALERYHQPEVARLVAALNASGNAPGDVLRIYLLPHLLRDQAVEFLRKHRDMLVALQPAYEPAISMSTKIDIGDVLSAINLSSSLGSGSMPLASPSHSASAARSETKSPPPPRMPPPSTPPPPPPAAVTATTTATMTARLTTSMGSATGLPPMVTPRSILRGSSSSSASSSSGSSARAKVGTSVTTSRTVTFAQVVAPPDVKIEMNEGFAAALQSSGIV